MQGQWDRCRKKEKLKNWSCLVAAAAAGGGVVQKQRTCRAIIVLVIDLVVIGSGCCGIGQSSQNIVWIIKWFRRGQLLYGVTIDAWIMSQGSPNPECFWRVFGFMILAILPIIHCLKVLNKLAAENNVNSPAYSICDFLRHVTFASGHLSPGRVSWYLK